MVLALYLTYGYRFCANPVSTYVSHCLSDSCDASIRHEPRYEISPRRLFVPRLSSLRTVLKSKNLPYSRATTPIEKLIGAELTKTYSRLLTVATASIAFSNASRAKVIGRVTFKPARSKSIRRRLVRNSRIGQHRLTRDFETTVGRLTMVAKLFDRNAHDFGKQGLRDQACFRMMRGNRRKGTTVSNNAAFPVAFL
jgi:hypothetical protein